MRCSVGRGALGGSVHGRGVVCWVDPGAAHAYAGQLTLKRTQRASVRERAGARLVALLWRRAWDGKLRDFGQGALGVVPPGLLGRVARGCARVMSVPLRAGCTAALS